MNYIDLFAGCGGLSLGLSQSGMTPMFAIEANSDAFATYRHNLIDKNFVKVSHDWPDDWLSIGPHNIRSLRASKQRFEKPLRRLRGKVDLVAGGPPCQGYSMLGRRNSADPRNRLVHDYLWFVDQVRPRFVLLENVTGMMADFNSLSGNGGARKRTTSGAAKLRSGLETNYRILTSKIFYASDYGVPQNRPRFITIGIRRDVIPGRYSTGYIENLAEELMASCREQFLDSLGIPRGRKISCSQAISDLETTNNDLVDYDEKGKFKRIKYGRPRTKFQREMHGQLNGTTPNSLRLPNHRAPTQATFSMLLAQARNGSIPTGRNIDREILLNAGVKKHYFAILDRHSPSRTISTLPDDVMHYSEPRILTVRENARLQSFPDWFEFQGKYTTGGHRRKFECPRYTQVGNAVAPRFGQFLGHYLLELDSHRP